MVGPIPLIAGAAASAREKRPLKKQQTPRKIIRADLYAMVWRTPMHKLAPEFGISDVGLAKLCRRQGVPLPPRGYWAKLHFGKRVRRPPLRCFAQGAACGALSK